MTFVSRMVMFGLTASERITTEGIDHCGAITRARTMRVSGSFSGSSCLSESTRCHDTFGLLIHFVDAHRLTYDPSLTPLMADFANDTAMRTTGIPCSPAQR